MGGSYPISRVPIHVPSSTDSRQVLPAIGRGRYRATFSDLPWHLSSHEIGNHNADRCQYRITDLANSFIAINIQKGAPMSPPKTNDTDESLWIQAFREVLARDDIRSDSDFFQLGGYSLLLPRLLWRYESLSGWQPPVSLVFEFSSPRELAAASEKYRHMLAHNEYSEYD